MERRGKKNLLELKEDTVILAQDESRFVSESNRITSWSIKGTSISYSGYRYGTALNCFGSFNLSNGHLISSFHDKGNALETIEHFKIVRKHYGDKPIAYFIDNASWHKTKIVQEYCEKNDITLLFLPPYSPEYNPIERVWGYLKSKVKNIYFSTAKKFTDFITDLLQNINQTDKNTLLKLCSSLI
ncbi:MAG TPA: IS630 family transposase [Sulfurospirillum arcachonense]|nr:IS630 family transposase [Sulfurospirillum arcachonense]